MRKFLRFSVCFIMILAMVTTACAAPSGKKQSGFSSATNQKISFGGVSLEIPSYFDVLSEESSDTYLHYYPEEKDYYCSLSLAIWEDSLTQKEFEKNSSAYAKNYLNGISESSNGSLIYKIKNSKATKVAGAPGRIVTCDLLDDKKTKVSSYIFALLYRPSLQRVLFIGVMEDVIDASNYDYLGDFNKIIASIQQEGAAEKAHAKSGIRDSFKKTMDEFEAFFDDYVRFMEKYAESEDVIGLMGDYFAFMQKYTTTMEALEEIDDGSLSDEELLYYTEIMLRINNKLLQAM